MGMYCLNMLAIALELAKEILRTKMLAASSSSTRVHRARHDDFGAGGQSLVDDETVFITTYETSQWRRALPENPFDGGPDSAVAVETLEPEIVDACPDSSGACNGSSTIIRTCPNILK